MKCKLDKCQCGSERNIMVVAVVDVCYIFAPFNLFDQSHLILNDKQKYS